MNIRTLFKISVVSFILLLVGAVYVSLAGPDEVSSREVNTLTYLVYLGPRSLRSFKISPVEVQEPLPHRVVQEYQVDE